MLASYVSQLTGIPLVICTHAYDIFSSPPENYLDLADTAARIVTISNYNKKYLIDKHRVPSDKVSVVHCGVSNDWMAQQDQQDEGIDSERPLSEPFELITVGRLVEKKGHAYLIEACALLREAGLDFRLTIIGDGDRRAELVSLIANRALENEISLLGSQTSLEVRAAVARSDLFVMSSLSEGIPVALMESMALGVPAVATNITGVPELVEHGVTGWLAKAGDAASLADTISYVLNNPAERSRCVHKARKRVNKEFNAEHNYRLTVDIWQAALADRNMPVERASRQRKDV